MLPAPEPRPEGDLEPPPRADTPPAGGCRKYQGGVRVPQPHPGVTRAPLRGAQRAPRLREVLQRPTVMSLSERVLNSSLSLNAVFQRYPKNNSHTPWLCPSGMRFFLLIKLSPV